MFKCKLVPGLLLVAFATLPNGVSVADEKRSGPSEPTPMAPEATQMIQTTRWPPSSEPTTWQTTPSKQT